MTQSTTKRFSYAKYASCQAPSPLIPSRRIKAGASQILRGREGCPAQCHQQCWHVDGVLLISMLYNDENCTALSKSMHNNIVFDSACIWYISNDDNENGLQSQLLTLEILLTAAI